MWIKMKWIIMNIFAVRNPADSTSKKHIKFIIWLFLLFVQAFDVT